MLTSIKLQNFRNYENQTFSFSPTLTIITGENGVGKTNIIEAITALAFVKPFRSHKREVFVSHEKPFGKITGYTNKEELDIYWGISLGKKLQIKKNELLVTTAEYMKTKNFLAVIFSPEDLNLPFLSPQHRRNFLSRLLSSLFPEYFSSALAYKSVLQHRNSLLKKYAEKKANKNEFSFWNTQLAKHQKILHEYHFRFFNFANQFIEKEYAAISGKQEWVEISPEYSCEDSEKYHDLLEKNFEKDVWRGATSKGVHRDDFSLLLRNSPLQESASRGETRSVLLALKKIEQLFIEKHAGIQPILLLDDVFSELDHAHQKHLIASIANYQCIITTTEIEIDIPENLQIEYIRLSKKL